MVSGPESYQKFRETGPRGKILSLSQSAWDSIFNHQYSPVLLRDWTENSQPLHNAKLIINVFLENLLKKTKNSNTFVARLSNLLLLFYQQLTGGGDPGSNGAFARALVDWALRPGFAIVTIPAQPTVGEHALARDLTDATVTVDHAQVLCTLPLLPTFKADSTSAILVYLKRKRNGARIAIPRHVIKSVSVFLGYHRRTYVNVASPLFWKCNVPRLHRKSFTGKRKREISVSCLNRNRSNSFVETRCIALYS